MGKNRTEAFTLLLKCEQLGFSFDDKLLNVISNASIEEMESFWKWMVKMNERVYGAANYKPMYPNFPKQVIEANELELLINAFMHYSGDFFGMRILPIYKEKSRKDLKETVNPLRMSAVTEDSIQSYFVSYITANTSLSPAVKEIVKNMFNYLVEKDVESISQILVNNKIPQKENLAFVGGLVLKSKLDFNKVLSDQFKTPTDLLRLSAAINDGDTSLAVDTKIKNMSRPMRKAFAAKLEVLLSSGDKEQFLENMFRYKEQWTRLAHAIHIGEYKEKVPNAFEALQKIRSNDKGESFNFKVEKLIFAGKFVQASELLKSRPGVFGRMLNQVLGKAESLKDQDVILKNFKTASVNIATPVLLQIHAKFKYDNQSQKKIILPKGGLGKVYVRDVNEEFKRALTEARKEKKNKSFVIESALQKELKQKLNVVENNNGNTDKPLEATKLISVSYQMANKIVDIVEEALIARFKTGESLGKVYIEDDLMLQNVPFAQRTASKALRTVPKGSRFSKESDKPIIRFFTWWNERGVDKNGNDINVGRIDIDLSVGIYDRNYNLIKQCAYYDLRSSDYLAHSGDITSAPNGAAEYIDVNIDKLKDDIPEAAFVGQLISSFTGQKYADLPECYAGWMEREQKQHGEIFEASTVKNKVDVTAEATQVLTCLYDIARKEYIWADTPIKGVSYANNLNSVRGSLAYAIQGLAEMKKPNLYDLFEMHAKARGEIVINKEEADTVFSIHEGVTPFDFEIIASKFMADEYGNKEPKANPKAKKK